MIMKKFPVGKLSMEHLSYLLSTYGGAPDDAVIVGSHIGEDAAVIKTGEDLLIAKTDPITFATDRIGDYTIQINANDIACMGGKPKWFLSTVLLPEGKTDVALIEKVFSQISHACRQLGIAVCGGHTEVTHGLDRTIVVGQMLGVVSHERLVRSSGARPGDHILLTKGVAIEATSLLARERQEELSEVFDRQFIERCQGFLVSPGISVLREAEIAVDTGGVHAMHDPTEGGIATGLYELAISADVGLEVWADAISIFPETETLCNFFRIDPLGVIASGALLISAEPSSAEIIVDAVTYAGITCIHIGMIREKSEGIVMVKEAKNAPLPRFDQDEISRVL